MAKVATGGKGLALDYNLLNSGTNNYRFKSDVTTYISGPVTLGGTNVLEAGTVLKFACWAIWRTG